MVARINGELVVWDESRLAFERLQQRLARRGRGGAGVEAGRGERSSFGWDSSPALSGGTRPCEAPNRRNSPTTVVKAFAVPRDG
ncbi:hypothetical protein GCM10010508_63230 [Streptomyces naganishii JCM 4654]|uniref:Uncharacterized protein n=1 Tax=Streptomyces naganishii JCM 4654 TaxID=1306179 RepID=A0A918Y9L8_9ACTN|nr:hypothetical protein GCM10010508_63230 [Streptomyces naganishii JCM 4654]